MLAGEQLARFSLYQILHHNYEYFASGEGGGWHSYFAYLGLGLFFFVAGLIGWVRSTRSKRTETPPDRRPAEP